MSEDQARTKRRAVGAAVFAVLAIGGMVLNSHTADHGSSGSAESACRDAVQSQLRAPATASFGSEQSVHTGDAWTVTGTVDSQNGFGADVRSYYSCALTYSGGTFTVNHVAGIDGGSGTGFGSGEGIDSP